MSRKNGCNNLYFYFYNLDEKKKLFFYMTSLSRRGPVNTSISTFANFYLTKTIKN